MKKEIIDILNKLINKELYSSYLYLSYSNILGYNGLKGYSKYYKKKSINKLGHSERIRLCLLKQGYKVELYNIDIVNDYSLTLIDILNNTYDNESCISEEVNILYNEAIKYNDFRTKNLVDFFINEQYIEETEALGNIDRYNVFGKDNLYKLDKEIVCM